MADEREIAQVQPILDTLEGCAAWPPQWREDGGTVAFLYREGTVLTRSADVDRVQGALEGALRRRDLGGDTRVEPVRATDVVALRWPVPVELDEARTVPAILDELVAADRRSDGEEGLPPGIARPEHVLYLTGHPCPADEPVPVPAGTGPTATYGTAPCPGTHGGHGRGVRVGLVDTGIDDATVKATPWLDGVTGEPDQGVAGGVVAKYGGHGTFSAGCVRSVAARCDVHVVEAVPRPDPGQTPQQADAAYETEVVAAVERALDRGPDVLLVCFAGASHDDLGLVSFEDLYQRRLRWLTRTAIIAPAGNDGWATPMFPAAYPWCTGVGALDATGDAAASWSNRGWWVDVWAPGTDLVNAFASGDYTYDEPPRAGTTATFEGMARWSGTSFAAPLVAGMVAQRAQVDGISAPQALRRLLVQACWPDASAVGPRLIPG